MELTLAGAELLFALFDGLGFEYTDVDEFPSDWHIRFIEPPTSVFELLFEESTNEFSISLVNVSIAFVAGLGNDACSVKSNDVDGNATLNFSLFSESDGNVSIKFICSAELADNFETFFFRRGGATGPLNVKLSVVFECASFVLAITSGSGKKATKFHKINKRKKWLEYSVESLPCNVMASLLLLSLLILLLLLLLLLLLIAFE